MIDKKKVWFQVWNWFYVSFTGSTQWVIAPIIIISLHNEKKKSNQTEQAPPTASEEGIDHVRPARQVFFC